MRLLHTSDWHLGRTLHGEDLLPYQASFLDWLLGEAAARGADAVLVAGDVYDRAVPPVDAVAVLDRALRGFAAASVPVIMISGNHDSAIRLGFGASLSERAGVHVRASVADIARPVVLADAGGDVAVYGIPYLLPDAAGDELGIAERSHAGVLAAAMTRIRADAAARGIGRVVVLAHAFVTGAAPCESERDIRVGGIGDAPASVFDGVTYVALGHLHGQQAVPASHGTTARYSGSPLAFSFSERHHAKSVTLAEVDDAGDVRTTLLPAPVPRPLRELTGRLDDLLARADAGLADAWLKVVLTDPARPASPMERLREKWPHTLVLDFAPEGGLACAEADLRRLAAAADPVEVCALHAEFAGGGPPDAEQRAVLAEVVEAVTHREAAA